MNLLSLNISEMLNMGYMKLYKWYLVYSYLRLTKILASTLCLNHLNYHVCLPMLALLVFAFLGSSKPRVSRRNETRGGWSDGTSPGMCGHSNSHHPSAFEDTLRWVGGWIWSVGGLRVPRPVSSGMVSAHWVPAAASSATMWVPILYIRSRSLTAPSLWVMVFLTSSFSSQVTRHNKNRTDSCWCLELSVQMYSTLNLKKWEFLWLLTIFNAIRCLLLLRKSLLLISYG